MPIVLENIVIIAAQITIHDQHECTLERKIYRSLKNHVKFGTCYNQNVDETKEPDEPKWSHGNV